MVLGDPERPAELGPARPGVVVGELADGTCRHPGLVLGEVERVAVDGGGVAVEADRGAADELVVGEPGVDDLPADGVGEGDVGADVDAEPHVGPLRRGGAPRIDRVHLGAVAHALDEVVEEDRMGFARVRAPQDDQVRVLDLPIAAGAATSSEYRRQTGDARSVSGAVA